MTTTAAVQEQEKVREAVAVFHDEESLRAAVDELLISGFDRSLLSLLASHKAVEEKLGAKSDRIREIEDEPEVPIEAYSGPDSRAEAKGLVVGGLAYVGAVGAVGAIVASGGTIAAALMTAGAAGGAGGLIGAALSKFIDDHHAHYMQEQLDRGGLLLWVRTPDADHEARAVEILKRHSADDVHVHDLPDVKYDLKGGVSHEMSFLNLLGL